MNRFRFPKDAVCLKSRDRYILPRTWAAEADFRLIGSRRIQSVMKMYPSIKCKRTDESCAFIWYTYLYCNVK